MSMLVVLNGCSNTSDDITSDDLDNALISALQETANGNGLSDYILPESDNLTAIPQDPNNTLTPQKVQLGRLLFHETAISLNSTKGEGKGTFSCASCHHSQGGFQACMTQGIGEGGTGFGTTGEGRTINTIYNEDEIDVQPIRTPSAMNTAYQKNMLWNGQFGATGLNAGTENLWTSDTPKENNNLGYEGLETQAIAGLGVHRLVIHDSVFVDNKAEYVDLFASAFADIPANERITTENGGLAIAAYERTLLANEAPFQQWLRGNTEAMNESEKMGALLFFGKAQCASCHNGPALNSMAFYALGMNDLTDGFAIDPDNDTHKGRGGFTGKHIDMFKFKVPQLYNLKNSPFYGHGASFNSITDVVRYKNEAIAENNNVPSYLMPKEFRSLNLTEEEISYIANFIENALYDPNLSRYTPSALPSGSCFPNNDNESRDDLGCN